MNVAEVCLPAREAATDARVTEPPSF
ncbi:hypothetical protein CT0861_13247, partial [Colletotrichum tofieldiae]